MLDAVHKLFPQQQDIFFAILARRGGQITADEIADIIFIDREDGGPDGWDRSLNGGGAFHKQISCIRSALGFGCIKTHGNRRYSYQGEFNIPYDKPRDYTVGRAERWL